MKITICGSIAFYNEMGQLRDNLVAMDHEVLIPLLKNEVWGDKKIYFGKYIEDNGGLDAFPPTHELWNLKEGAIRDHYERIGWCDAVVISNHDKRGIQGYIGGNTLMEIGVAFYLKKPIYILNPVSSELSYKQEIYGMKPVLLNGDLNLIPSNLAPNT